MDSNSSERKFRIAIDGPAGAGKTTLATLLAKTLGFMHINTGLLYRAFSYVLLNKLHDISIQELENMIVSENKQLTAIIDSFSVILSDNKIILENNNITDNLRTPYIDSVVGIISKYKIVREKVKKIQKTLISTYPKIVVEGRDIGSAIIPDAELKIYLEASVEERAIRREKEKTNANKIGNHTLSLEEIEKKIKQRDLLDETRQISPLVKTADAIVIDNTNLTVEDTVKKIQKIILSRDINI